MRNPLLDLEFLRKLDLMRNKATYAKIILLTWDENPVYEIQGKITAGSINIDGASAVRRTCSLTMVSPDVDITNTYWALKNKFKLEVGVENLIDSQHPDIIWFKQGVYVFTSLNMNVQSNNFTISLNGKDKMCLLNGEVGGSLNASTDFGKLEEYETLENGEIIRNIIDIPIVDIIKNSVHTYAKEPFNNIILNDIDDYGLELLEYRGDNNLYMPRRISSGEVSNMVLKKSQTYYLQNGEQIYVDNELNRAEGKKELIYYDRTGINRNIATKVWASRNDYYEYGLEAAYNIIKVEYGQTAGYRRTPLTYPGDLVGNVGESLVSILDKIKNMFSDFEYFYDIDGRFVFQKKKTYINTSFNNLQTEGVETYATDSAYTSSITYSFENGTLLSAFTNAPQILNIKNDYSVWGKRKGVNGSDIPVHLRYAIDFKPVYYKPVRFVYERVFDLDEETYQPNKYYIYSTVLKKYIISKDTQYDKSKRYYIETEEQDLDIEPFTDEFVDWREIICQMALDYFKYNHKKSNFNELVATANPDHYPTGVTGYENYYTDLQGFWRQLYHPGAKAADGDDDYYNLFTYQELYEAAREVILEERKFIQEEDIAQLILDYVEDNFVTIRNNFINSINYEVGNIDPARDIIDIIARCINYGFTENTKVIQGLLTDRWEKMGQKDKYYEADRSEKSGGYQDLMDEARKNNEMVMYKAFQMCSNYAADKYFLEEWEDEDISLQIENKIKQGYTEYSSAVQNLLSLRWKKMMLKYGEDPYDYLTRMEEEYVDNGESAAYKTYLLLYDYTNQQKQQYVDEDRIIMQEGEGGVIDIKDPYLSFLFLSRQKKINNLGYDNIVVSNENLLRVIVTIIKTFETTKKGFSSAVIEMLQQQLDRSAYDFSQELIEYIADNYESRHNFFYVNNTTNKISVEHAHIQYLLDMRQEKIKELGEDAFYVSNDLLVITMLELFEKYGDKQGEEFKVAIEEKLEEIYTPLDKTEYDFSNEIIEYIYINYEKRATMFYKSDLNNSYEVKDQYLQFLFIMRQEKINELYDEDFYPQNDMLVTILGEAMEMAGDEAEWFKTEANNLMDKFQYQIKDSNSYDFSIEIVDYIYKHYDQKNSFFLVNSNNTTSISIINPYLQYLFNLRQEKINKIGDSFKWMRNSKLIKLLVDTINTKETAEEFKQTVEQKMDEQNNSGN